MVYSANTLNGFTLKCRDGYIGRVHDFYFDDRHWAIRYLVADTDGFLAHLKVLISPYAMGGVSSDDRNVSIDLTRQQIEDSPSLDSDKPVSRQYEELYHGHFGWPIYWDGPFTWGAYPRIMRDPEKRTKPAEVAPPSDHHLRSINAVDGHHVHANDGEIGHIKDFLLDDATWSIRYLVIDTKNWWPGKKVLVAPTWIDRVSWDDKKVFVNLNRDVIREAPEYVPGTPLTREFETQLHQHYQRPGYWLEGPVHADEGVEMGGSSNANTGN